ncbi:MAG: hypothetical protein JNL58_15030 [Planctomyces sp.]|nr:hypothetical protein [Planctomyces sp.]
MVSAFGGAGSSLDRRRRLMSADEREVSDAILRDFGIVLPSESDPGPHPSPEGERFLPRLISQRLWKHWAILGPLLLFSVLHAARLALFDRTSSALDRISSADQMVRMATGVSGILLILSSQLCLVIGWMRSQSTVDFHGGYRAWRWAAAMLGVAGFCGLTGLTQSLPNDIASLVEPLVGRVAAARLVIVFVPGILVTLPVIYRLIPDMSRCRCSQAFMVTGLLSLAACLMFVTGRFPLVVPAQSPNALLMLASSLIFTACMLHCRFVMYISNDPPLGRMSSNTKALSLPAVAGPLASTGPSDEHQPEETKTADSQPAAPVTHGPADVVPESDRSTLPNSEPADAQSAKNDRKKGKNKQMRKAG